MSSRARKAQRLSQHNSFDSTSKHSRNEEFSQQRETGDDSGDGTAQDFTAIEVGQFLELDPRPTFVLNLDTDLDEALEPIFMNNSLHSDQQLLKSLQFSIRNGSSQDQFKTPNPDFNAWIKDIVQLRGLRASTEFPLAGIVWKGFLVEQYVICVPISVSSLFQSTWNIMSRFKFSFGLLHCSSPFGTLYLHFESTFPTPRR
jgi:hypothetical protein